MYNVLEIIIAAVSYLVLAQIILSLLFNFNVISHYNEFAGSVWRVINQILDPVLNPIRRIMPDTGQLDLSPMVLLLGLRLLSNLVH